MDEMGWSQRPDGASVPWHSTLIHSLDLLLYEEPDCTSFILLILLVAGITPLHSVDTYARWS